MLIAVCVVLAVGLLAVPAEAAPGELDSSFGSDGKVLTTVGTFRFDEAHGVVVQPDGKIIAAGTAGHLVGGSFALARYNANGSLDLGFGSGGRVSTFFADASATGEAIALQPDGKIVVVGGVRPFSLTPSDFALARYNPDGSLDPGFGVGGQVTTDLGSSSFEEKAWAVAIQPDGGIVVVGASGSHAVVVRYTSSGSLDAGFGNGGVVPVDFPDLPSSTGIDVALQPDGKIIIVGQTLTAVARLNSNGSFDSGFGSGGKVPSGSLPAIDNHAAAVALQSDGKIVLAGGGPTGGFAVARYNADGTLDVEFGRGGLVTADFGSWAFAYDLILQADGKIVVAGVAAGSFDDPTSSFALARYTPGGGLDDTFGAGGQVTTRFFEGFLVSAEVHAVALQPDGRIVAAGLAYQGFAGGSGSFALARYLDGAAEVLAVAIDIRPGTETNPINLRSKGVVPVAILSTADFDATSVDLLSVRFGPAGATARGGRGHFEDVDGDGDIDLVLHFRTQETGIAHGTSTACLTGQTLGGAKIQGCDAAKVR